MVWMGLGLAGHLIYDKGASIYYVITLGGVGGPDTNDDIDDALRGGEGNHQNDDVIYEWVLSELPCNLST